MNRPAELLAELVAAAPAVPLEQVPSMIGRLEELKAALWIRASSPASTKTEEGVVDDPLLDVRRVANRLGVSVDWVYDNQRLFKVVRVGRSLRFQESAVEKYLRSRAVSRIR